MDIGKTDNFKFYEGYEDEPEIEFTTNNSNIEILHIWDGFFDDIFRKPNLDGKGWRGFTRDYHQCEGAFDDNGEAEITNIQEYIDDLKTYESRKFDYKETKEVYKLIYSWLNEAKNKNCKKIKVRVI